MFRKKALREISKSFLLAEAAEYTVCKTAKNGLPTKYFKDALKLTENPPEEISNGVPYQRLADLQSAAFSTACF